MTILLVEDEIAVRAIARRVLEREGFIVLEAGSPLDALRLAEASVERISLVLSDVVMPGMTGAELGDAIRVVQPDVPILLMSGYAEEDVQDRVNGLGAAGFVAKPFTPRGLAAAVRQALERSTA
jgi:CheY-like chemotaxis protein